MGMYVSKKRVIRDGYLVAHEGEEMSEEEAIARGLIKTNDKPKATRSTPKAKGKAKATKAEKPAEEKAEEAVEETTEEVAEEIAEAE